MKNPEELELFAPWLVNHGIVFELKLAIIHIQSARRNKKGDWDNGGRDSYSRGALEFEFG